MMGLTARARIKAVGTAAVLVVALAVFYGIAWLPIEPPWMKLVLCGVPGVLILSGIVWMLSGGERGTNVEVQVGDRRASITNVNLFARAFARDVLAFMGPQAPLPRPAGRLGRGSPADPANVIEGEAEIPPGLEIAEKPLQIPKDAGHLS
jgi:hypothetical protein